ncbi:hypothetical protein AL542_17565 [Grimontia hollisae]|uniref:Uncharacterized protein n=1 Tax=Grimontia hollisae CIP 101886 TaxID=675812 RepID=D0IAU5_GRIHO|nr:hypothetical protein AL542_17565 [Grimontia hollisae]EEY71013.1 hypothetical protein VHA_002872 [Grimontia hollisae CIP 101886]
MRQIVINVNGKNDNGGMKFLSFFFIQSFAYFQQKVGSLSLGCKKSTNLDILTVCAAGSWV